VGELPPCACGRASRDRADGWLVRAPGTLVYLFTLMVTQLSLTTVSDRLAQRLLLQESTTPRNLAHEPLQVLVCSAFWIDADAVGTALTVVAVVAVMVPAERWLGTRRWLGVFCGRSCRRDPGGDIGGGAGGGVQAAGRVAWGRRCRGELRPARRGRRPNVPMAAA
jgi:hypothetical protein